MRSSSTLIAGVEVVAPVAVSVTVPSHTDENAATAPNVRDHVGLNDVVLLMLVLASPDVFAQLIE